MIRGISPRFFNFGPFSLDLTERHLLRTGEEVLLTPKAFDTLVMLVQNSGHLVEKDELLKSIWPESLSRKPHSPRIFLLSEKLWAAVKASNTFRLSQSERVR